MSQRKPPTRPGGLRDFVGEVQGAPSAFPEAAN
jgi:hypothetical protein